MKPAEVLESFSIMMGLGLVLGVLLGGFPAYTKEISIVSLAVLMTLSLSTVRLSEARGREHYKHAAFSIVLNYGLLSGIILTFRAFFSGNIWHGWVLMAAAPSAISIVPFMSILGGKTSKALFSTAMNYVLALALMPLMALVLIGSSVSAYSLMSYILLLIVLPMGASRAVMRLSVPKRTNSILMNISFAVLIFAVAGSNRDAFIGDIGLVMAISAACLVRTFGTGLLTEFSLERLRVDKSERIGYVLFASYKNLGLTATLAIALFEPAAAVPATICIVFEVVWVIFLTRWWPHVK
jgi:BASS family bile acid:Na+ symporter